MRKSLHISQDTFNDIELYLRKEMNADDLNIFEARLETDNELRDQVEEIKLLLLGVEEASLSDKLNVFHGQLPIPLKKHINANTWPLRRWLAAASIVVLVSSGLWIFFNIKNENRQLFAEYFAADPGLITAMSGTEDYLFDRAMVDYKTGNYTAATEAWQKLLTERSGSDTLNYFMGSAFLAANNPEKAVGYFEKVIGQEQSAFRSDAYWYLGLALLDQNRIAEAVTYIGMSDHPDKETLLSRLKH